MKFIKNNDHYISVAAIRGLTVSRRFDYGAFSVVASISETEYEKLYTSKSEAEARAWLDEFVAKLNVEASHVED
ncbi:MAG: hypothetical protein IJQ82_00910 [Selenomonadaceae bacterium]|nr:hypothetical protein [Selenomonadaceae bacterium]